MVKNDFNAVVFPDTGRVLSRYPWLANLSILLSLLFSASIIGLFINLLVNSHRPMTHTFFLLGILVSLAAGVGINALASYWARRSAKLYLKTLLEGKEA